MAADDEGVGGGELMVMYKRPLDEWSAGMLNEFWWVIAPKMPRALVVPGSPDAALRRLKAAVQRGTVSEELPGAEVPCVGS